MDKGIIETLKAEVEELHFYKDYNDLGEEIKCLDIAFADKAKTKIKLWNVSGKIALDTVNGFYSGLVIDDLSVYGYEKENRFYLYSCEQDIDLNIYFEKISIETA